MPWALWAQRRLPVGLLVTDPSGRVRWANARACSLLEADPAGQVLPALFAEHERVSVAAYVERVWTGRPPDPDPDPDEEIRDDGQVDDDRDVADGHAVVRHVTEPDEPGEPREPADVSPDNSGGPGTVPAPSPSPSPGTVPAPSPGTVPAPSPNPAFAAAADDAADDDADADHAPRPSPEPDAAPGPEPAVEPDITDDGGGASGPDGRGPELLGTVCRPDGSVQRVRLCGIRHGRWWPRLIFVVAALNDLDATDEIVREALADDLTGLPSRVLFMRHLKAIRERRRRQTDRGSGALALINLDAFRRINDVHGHLVGDQVLRAVADRLVLSLPRNAVVSRLAGDEFGVLLPTHTPEEAALLLERVATSIAAQPLRHANVPITVHLSAGVTGLGGRYLDTVVAQADRALTHAKADRSRCAVLGTGDDIVPSRRELYEHIDQLTAENSRLAQTTLTDHLTGLPNTRALDQALDELDDSYRGHGAEYSLLFVDLDRFGAYNKTHGDSAGDRALRTVGQTLRDNCRQGETVFRKGGEELVVVLPGCGREAAARVGERLRRAVEELALPHGGHPDTPVVTITVAVATVEAEFSAHELMDHASKGAFATKIARQRNRVVVTGPPTAA